MEVDLTQIPALTELRRHGSRLAFQIYFREVWRDVEWRLQFLTRNFVRLADLAIEEYENGRINVGDYWEDDSRFFPVGPAIRASGHFETCIAAAHRAVLHLGAARDYRGTLPPGLRPLLPARAEVLSGGGDDDLRLMRQAIQHAEDRLLGASIPPFQAEEAAILNVTGVERQRAGTEVRMIDRLELGGHRILLADLAAWLRELHGYAQAVAEYDRKAPPALPPP